MEQSTTQQMNWDDFKAKSEAVVANFGASGLLMGDEADDTEISLCLLIPESCVALLIGKAGANINTTKQLSGANVSFQKKENSVRGYRKCFHSGTVAGVLRAVSIALSFVQEIVGGPCAATVVVNHDAAGGVIGKGGENLKNVRETTNCKVSMEKAQEAMPAYGGRCLSLEEQDMNQVIRAIYQCARVKGFSSPTSRDDQAARFSPYGAGPRQDVCSIHGKRRGKQNLRPSPTVPGQYVCLDTDQCKGVSNPNSMGASYMMGGMGGMGSGMGGMGGGAMGGMNGMGAMGAMGGMGGGMGLGVADMSMYGGMFGMGGMGGMNTGICALHGKKRGPKNLQPHPSQPGLFICMEHDACKGGSAMGGLPGQDMGGMPGSVCATHGKRRGPRNLQPHPSQPGLFVCLDEDQCK